MPDYTISFWIFAVVAVLFSGISKAGFGGGVGMVSTPLLALSIPVVDAAAIMLPLLIACDLFSVFHYRARFDARNVRILLSGAVVGIGIASLFFGYFRGNDSVLRAGIGILAIGFVVFQVMRSVIFGLINKHQPGKVQGVLMGVVSGFTSTLIHAGGPPVAVYLLPQKMPRDRYVGTTVIYFAIVNAVKLIPYSGLGLLHIGQWSTILVLAPFAFIGVRLGVWLNRRFSEVWFTRLIYGILLITGIQLIS